jgi:hypothetical protein
VSRRYALAIPVFFAPMVPARRRRIRLMPRPGCCRRLCLCWS